MKIPSQHLTIPASKLAQASKIDLEILPDSQLLLAHMARSIANEIKTNNSAGKPTRLILPVGPIDQYPLLIQICNQEKISWKNVFTFNMDEYCDWQGRSIPFDHPLSFAGYMKKCVFDQLDGELQLPSSQIHFPDPLALDSISQRIEEIGGIDTCYGGIGYHGHIAFNEPPNTHWQEISVEQFRNSLTRVVPLSPDTIVMNSTWNTGGNPANIPPMAVTLGMKDILGSRRIRLYCSGGPWQRTVLRVALLSEMDVSYPVSLLQDHSDYAIFSDLETAQPAETSTT
jgi:glucosamine-6-phosphate deaminase